MNFFLVKPNFEGNLYSTYVVKVFLAGITILSRRDWTIKKMPEIPLKVQRPLTDVPQAYELKEQKTQIWVGGNAGVNIIFLKRQMFFGHYKYPKKLIFLELSKILPSASSQHN